MIDGGGSAVRALVEREGVFPLVLLIAARGEPTRMLFFEGSFVGCIAYKSDPFISEFP